MTRLDPLNNISKPTLLLDVDGVIVLLGEPKEATFELEVAGFPVRIAAATPARLQRLSKAFRVAWCSSWERDTLELGEALQMPQNLPYLRFGNDLESTPGNYKLAAVERFIEDQPAAWVDDDVGDDVQQWASERPHPTLLVMCDPRTGLRDHDVDELLDFADRLETK